jgi:uridylate kinase
LSPTEAAAVDSRHQDLRYGRILLKLSGESLAGPSGYGIDPDAVADVARKVQEVAALGCEVAVVLGAGNLWRGASGMAAGMDRANADQIGMLATVMNALALQDGLEQLGRTVRVHTAMEMKAVAEPYIRRRAMHQMEKGYIVIVGAGTGNPFFTTDTAAALRAMELGADVLIKATKVDGVYSADPAHSPDATRFDHLSFSKALDLGVRVMDSTAITLCRENRMPIVVLSLWEPGTILAAVRGQQVGTRVDEFEAPDHDALEVQTDRRSEPVSLGGTEVDMAEKREEGRVP